MAQQQLVGAEVMRAPLEGMSKKLQPHEIEAALTSFRALSAGQHVYGIVGIATYDAATNTVTFEFETNDGLFKFQQAKASFTGSGSGSGPFQGTLICKGDITAGAQLFTFHADSHNFLIGFIKAGVYDKRAFTLPVVGLVGNGHGKGTWAPA